MSHESAHSVCAGRSEASRAGPSPGALRDLRLEALLRRGERTRGHVRGVGAPALEGRAPAVHPIDGEAQGTVDRPHPFRVAPGEVVVEGQDVHAAAAEGVQIWGDVELAWRVRERAGRRTAEWVCITGTNGKTTPVGMTASMLQAADYSATTNYLNAVKKIGTDDSTKVMAQLKATKINDMFTKNGEIRPDGRMVHDMYLVQVKSKAESKYPWDYYKLVATIPGAQAYTRKEETKCAAWK